MARSRYRAGEALEDLKDALGGGHRRQAATAVATVEPLRI